MITEDLDIFIGLLRTVSEFGLPENTPGFICSGPHLVLTSKCGYLIAYCYPMGFTKELPDEKTPTFTGKPIWVEYLVSSQFSSKFSVIEDVIGYIELPGKYELDDYFYKLSCNRFIGKYKLFTTVLRSDESIKLLSSFGYINKIKGDGKYLLSFPTNNTFVDVDSDIYKDCSFFDEDVSKISCGENLELFEFAISYTGKSDGYKTFDSGKVMYLPDCLKNESIIDIRDSTLPEILKYLKSKK